MELIAGHSEEYRRRHDEIWPDLLALLKQAGVCDYSIYFHDQTNSLFAVLKRSDNHDMDNLPLEPIMKKWWAYMADIMLTHESNEPVVEPLDRVFYME